MSSAVRLDAKTSPSSMMLRKRAALRRAKATTFRVWPMRRPRARVIDLPIAATAHAHGAAVYTRDPGDLHGIEHLVEIRAV